jgi:DNA polymerase bacteriophage-type
MTARKVEWGAEAAEDALTAIGTRDLATVELMFGDAMLAVSGSLRGLFVAAPGHELICADYSAIEAVGLAMLAGEQWRIDVFRTHGKIYEASGALVMGVPLEDVLAYPSLHSGAHHPVRKVGKVAELANGYGGWVGSSRAFGHTGTDEQIVGQISKWREKSPSVEFLWGGQSASPALIQFHAASLAHPGEPVAGPLWDAVVRKPSRPWDRDRQPYRYGCEGMMINAIQFPGQTFPVMRLDGTPTGLAFERVDDVVYMILPDCSTIAYHRPRLQPGKSEWRGLSISYEGWNTNPLNGPPGWQRMYTWGSRTVENADQAVCNRILRHSQANLEAACYPIVQHVYDENVSEVPIGYGSCEEYVAIMNRMPSWAADWPIRAAGAWRGRRYRK